MNIEVLVVDDDIRIANIHEKFINKIKGFTTVGISNDVEETKIWLETLKPDLVLLDIYFPEKLGTELIEYIKKKKLPVDIILITAASEVDIVKMAYNSGVVDFLLKPLTFQQFKECLERYRAKKILLSSNTKLSKEDINKLWNNTSTTIKELNPKGIDEVTKEKILNYLKNTKEGITAEGLAKNLGLSRSTARRYLEFLYNEGIIKVEYLYGKIGRPERYYTFIG